MLEKKPAFRKNCTDLSFAHETSELPGRLLLFKPDV